MSDESDMSDESEITLELEAPPGSGQSVSASIDQSEWDLDSDSQPDSGSDPESESGWGADSDSDSDESEHETESESQKKDETSELEQLKRDAAIEQARKDAQLEAARRDTFIGQVIARDYTIFKHIGEGQSSHIFTCKMVYTEGKFALKVLKKPDNTRTNIFRAAVRDMEDLEHNNIIKTRFYIESRDGDPCCMMEFFESVPLTEVLSSIKKIQSERVIILILLQIASALEYSHSKGVIHGHLTDRDVLTKDLVDTIIVKVTDFAMTELKDSSINSPDWHYMSPERLKGAPVKELSDVYALGVIGYLMITGFPPYNEKDFKAGIDDEPLGLRALRPDLKCGHELNQILRKAVEKDPSKRVQSMKDFKTRLIEIAEMFEGKRATTKKTYDTKVPDMPFSAHLNEIKGVSEDDEKEEKPKYKKRSKRQQITKTFSELVALKRNLYDQEQALAVKLAAAAAAGEQRRSPLSTVSRMFATIIICGGILTAALTYSLTHTKQLGQMFTTASIQLHKMLTPPPPPKPIQEEAPPPSMTAGTPPAAKRPGVPAQTPTAQPSATAAVPGTPDQPTDASAAPTDGSTAQTGNNPPMATGNNPPTPTAITPAQAPPVVITPASNPNRKSPGLADKDRELYKQFRERMSRQAY